MKKILCVLLTVLLMIPLFAACGEAPGPVPTEQDSSSGSDASASQEQKTYYYVGTNHGHPYWYDVHQGFHFAAEFFNVRVVQAGPDTYDPAAQAEALEQTITKRPDGIIVPLFDASVFPGIKKAMDAGIPVVVIESTMPDSGALAFVGLNAYDSGVETAAELIRAGGNSGNVAIIGNWGAANTDQKVNGFKDHLAANGNWNIVAELDDKAESEVAIEAAKSAFINYADLDAIIGLNSSSGPAIAVAMEELNLAAGSVLVICHDREDIALEYIEKGYIHATIASKTASMPWLAIAILEGYIDNNGANIPLSGNNATAGINPIPEFCYTGSIVINKDNVEFFKRDTIPEYNSSLYG